MANDGRLFVDIVTHQFDKRRCPCLIVKRTDGIKCFDEVFGSNEIDEVLGLDWVGSHRGFGPLKGI